MHILKEINKAKAIMVKKREELYRVARIWSEKNLPGLVIYNIIVLMLVLLHSAGYFHPFFPITINIIVFISLLLTVILLGATSRFMFVASTGFLIFAGILLSLNVRVWADRTMIYVFQSFTLGIIMLGIKQINSTK